MKKVKLFGIIVSVLLLAAGALALRYVTAPPAVFDLPAVSFYGIESLPSGGAWHTKVFYGLLTKNTPVDSAGHVFVGKVTDRKPELAIPEGADCTFELIRPYSSVSPMVAEGSYEDYQNFEYSRNGDYSLTVKLSYAAAPGRDAADFSYQFFFTMDVQPQVSFSSDRALQGDVLSVFADMGFESELPQIDTELGSPVFLPVEDNKYISFVPVNFDQKPAAYDITVNAGKVSFKGHVVVTPAIFEEQHMTISQETLNSTMNHPDANKDYELKIKSQWFAAEEVKHWSGLFIMPVEGHISTQFGLYRYTNGSPYASRHRGIDIGAAEGTPVAASGRGRVSFAGDVIITGKTLVIEHGGGLKTYYFHLNEIQCNQGDIVEKGQVIGLVGSTGYSTGAHLHFEVRIGEKSMNPWPLFDGSSEIYAFEENKESDNQ